jgi:hypothetical protein
MRVISKFHDYYDVGMKYGIDKTVLYIRTTEEIKNDHIDATKYLYKYPILSDRINWTKLTLSVCGKFYLCYRMNHTVYNKYGIGSEHIAYCYSLNEVESITKSFFPETYKGLDKPYGWIRKNNPSKRELLEWEFSNQGKPLPQDLHQKYKTPILVDSSHYTTHNTNNILRKDVCLKDLEFFRIEKDPIKLYQDIFMYISGFLGTPENKMMKINNTERILTHGFDLKYSFRKRPK